MLFQLIAVRLGDLALQALDLRVLKLDYLAGLDAHHVVMVTILVEFVDGLPALEMVADDDSRGLELIEHVPEPDSLIKACATLLKPGGLLVISTLNRNAASYLLGVVLAEYVLQLVPRGTHNYMQFVRPAELARMARDQHLTTRDIRGMGYNPFTRRAHLGVAPSINYLATFARDLD